MGLCMYSPPVNANGNSSRGLQFCRVSNYFPPSSTPPFPTLISSISPSPLFSLSHFSHLVLDNFNYIAFQRIVSAILFVYQRLVDTFNFHVYDSGRGKQITDKLDPRNYRGVHKVRDRNKSWNMLRFLFFHDALKEREITSIMYGARTGAISSMQRLFQT